MYRKLIFVIVVLASGCSLPRSARAQQEPSTLWAGLSINRSLFREGQTEDLQFYFAVVNDGHMIVDPKIEDTRIIVNGAELKEAGMPVFRNGLRPMNFNALKPGDAIEIMPVLGTYFGKSGTYQVSFKGADFETPPVVFRVLPKQVRRGSDMQVNSNRR